MIFVLGTKAKFIPVRTTVHDAFDTLAYSLEVVTLYHLGEGENER